MKRAVLNQDFLYEGDLGRFIAKKYVFGKRNIEAESEKLRLFFSFSPLELILSGEKIFVPERSAIKVQPGNEIAINSEKGSEIYSLSLIDDERELLERIKKRFRTFFESLDEPLKSTWNKMSRQDLDYIEENEKNARHIIRRESILIAPPYSRMNPASTTGWNLMYSRGSRALGIAVDLMYQVREQEIKHKHKLLIEPYICLGGKSLLDVNGEDILIQKDNLVIIEPGEAHYIKSILESPYKGVAVQFPSIPGDRICLKRFKK